MARHVQLTPQAHRGLTVRTDRSAALGDAVMMAPVFPHEFRRVQAHYPIVFRREGDHGRVRPYALFGLEQGSNLFLTEAGWDAPYLPVAHGMKPFVIGRAGDRLEVHVDLDDPRVGTGDGEALFAADGQPTEFLDSVSARLAEVHEAEQALTAFSAVLDDLELIEPFTLDVTLDDGQSGQLAGFFTIAEARLDQLEAQTLGGLQANGYLLPIFMAVASTSQFLDLIARRNALLRSAV